MGSTSGVARAFLGVGVVAVPALVWQWLDVYLAFGEIPTPSHAQIIRFRVTATLAIAAMLVALVLALREDRKWLARGSGVGLVVAVAVAVVFAVPSIDLHREPEQDGRPVDDTPCFSGTICDDAG
jgi:amino acid transporter